jgi:hypothetical protein
MTFIVKDLRIKGDLVKGEIDFNVGEINVDANLAEIAQIDKDTLKAFREVVKSLKDLKC